MAKQLSESDSMMMLGAGASGKEPLVMNDGGKPYRAFLESDLCWIWFLTYFVKLEIRIISQQSYFFLHNTKGLDRSQTTYGCGKWPQCRTKGEDEKKIQ